MNDFSAYEKIPKDIGEFNFSEQAFSELNKLTWVVTEKIHGANFSFVYQNKKLLFSKRKDYLSWNDDFFGFQLVVKDLENRILALFEALSQEVKAEKLTVYGELFGGEYPHPEVESNSDVRAVQTGVYYSPSIEFCAFDIAIEPSEGVPKYYLDYEAALTLFEKYNLLYAKPLFVGKLNDALNFDTRISSTIPTRLNLPPLVDNLIEGVVVKPLNFVSNDRLTPRAVVKIKNAEFEEEHYHLAEKWTFDQKISSNTEDLSFLMDELRIYITTNRLNSAISKIGRLDFDDARRVEEIELECASDAISDFSENNGYLLEDLNSAQLKWIEKRVSAEVNLLMATVKSRQR